MTAINNSNFHEEISYNLDIMEKSLKEGKEVDIGFIDIFANDIETVSTDKAELLDRLNRLANKIYDASEKSFAALNADSIRPLVGDNLEIKELVKEYKQGHVKAGLEKLDPHFFMRRVAGDGHCFFRAVATSILEFLQGASPAEQNAFSTKLKQSVDSLKATYPGLEAKYQSVFKIMLQLSTKKITIEEVLKNRDTSDRFVAFLRDLACAHNQTHGNETFEAEAVTEAGTKEKYLANIADMKKALMGGHAEILALNEALGIQIIPIPVRQVGRGEKEPAAFLQEAQASQKPSVFLLYRPGHYDVLFPKA